MKTIVPLSGTRAKVLITFALTRLLRYEVSVRKISLFISAGLGLGYIPWASGTFGTLWGALLFFLLRDWNVFHFALFTLSLFLISWPLVYWAEKELQTQDSSKIVIDEVLGYLVTVIAIPFNFWNLALAFGLFRFFDILKPFPIRQIERKTPGALGVILDDIAAGVLANLCLQLILLWK